MIPTFHFRSDTLMQDLAEVRARTLPFVMSLGLNLLAKAAQEAMKNHLKEKFELRRVPWNVNAIKIEKGNWATKTRLRVIISLDSRASYLEKFEDEGIHHPFGDRNYLWVPNEVVFRKRIIRAENPLHPKNLHMGSVIGPKRRNQGGGLQGLQNTFMIRGPKGPLVIQRIGDGQGTFFTPSSISSLTLRNFGKKRGGKLVREKSKGTRVLYALKERVKVPLKLEFVDTITQAVQVNAVPVFRDAITRALAPRR